MIVITARQPLPKEETKSLFLAGPSPRAKLDLSWRKEAIEILEKLGYDGIVYNPEYYEDEGTFNREAQTKWEYECMCACDAIVFWIPRELRPDFEMLGLTTNIEFGRFLNSNKLICGCPNNAFNMKYMKIISDKKYKWNNTLEDTLKAAMKYLGEGAYRKDIEVKIPLHIFNSKQFQNWYKPQLKVGNYLTDFYMEYEFSIPQMKQPFLEIFHPSVYIAREKRVKYNEFVVARTDMSYILAYHKNKNNKVIEIILCEEYRTPIRTDDEFVFELPGGSSFNPKDDPLEVASKELEEETGLKIDKSRFKELDMKQSASTLASHKIALFSVELTNEEINLVRSDTNVHGVAEDTERIHLHVMNLLDAIKKVDWTNAGMILYGLINESALHSESELEFYAKMSYNLALEDMLNAINKLEDNKYTKNEIEEKLNG